MEGRETGGAEREMPPRSTTSGREPESSMMRTEPLGRAGQGICGET